MNDAPFVDVEHTDGARARVYLDGAQVASWTPAGSTDDRLFVSANAFYGAGRSIRGGIPLCFPQFGVTGPMRQHGFSRLQRWHVLQDASTEHAACMVLHLADTHETRAEWPYRFHAELAVRVEGASLSVALTVSNTDSQPFAFTAALHPYFRVANAFATTVRGLRGTRYRDALRDSAMFDESSDVLVITGPLDRVYADTPDTLELIEPHRALRLEKHGFPDAVVWNPGAVGTSSRADFVPGDEMHMLCVEAGAIMRPIVVEAGKSWVGEQVMTAVG
ncbi:D-hexose-6-phosphate mutarotase [Gemmatimonas sp.]